MDPDDVVRNENCHGAAQNHCREGVIGSVDHARSLVNKTINDQFLADIDYTGWGGPGGEGRERSEVPA